jgi:WD40 repeat protein
LPGGEWRLAFPAEAGLLDGQSHAGLLAMPGSRVVLIGTVEHGVGSPLPAVPSVAATVRDLGRLLVERCGVAPENLITVLNPETPQQVHDVLTLAGEQASDALALFFTGHGLVGPDHELYLATGATRDLGHGSPVYQAFPYRLLREVVSRSRARAVLVVLDCCFSGLAHGVTQRVVDTLADTAQLSGFSLLTATGSDELAWAPADTEHTAFGGELIRLLRDGDPAAGAVLTVDAVYRSLTRRLAELGFPKPYQQIANGAGQWVLGENLLGAEPGPYRGLAYFRQEDADYFFGRDELIGELVERLGGGGPLIVTGSSGSGKSSLLRAGLIPALARMDLRPRGARRWAARVLTPGADPLGQLAMWLAAPAGQPICELRERLRHDPAELGAVLKAAGERTGEQVLLIVDQFEELFTVCEDEPTRRAFVAALASASGAAMVLLSLRAGYFGHCARYPELVPALGRSLVVTPMTGAEVREVIEKPARKDGLTLEEGLVELLLADLGDTVSLPLLSHALLTTWQHRTGNRLTLAGYRATGGIQRAVGRTADTLFERLDETSRDVARRLLVRLVRIGDGTGDTRRRLPLSELRSAAEGAAVQHVLDQLARERLIRIDRDTGESVDFVEIAHDALLRAWPRLQKWITVDRAGLLVRQQLTESAVTWDRHRRDPEFLYSGSRLAEVHAWLREHHADGPLGPTETAFIAASRHRRRLAVRRRRLTFLTLLVLLVLALGAATIVTIQRSEVERSRNLAQALVIARTSSDLRARNPTVAAQLGVAAYQTSETPDTRGALLSAVTMLAPTVLAGHDGPVNGVAFDPNSHVMATAAEDRTAKLWDVADRQKPEYLSTLAGHDSLLYALAINPKKPLVATASNDHTVRLWNIANPRSPQLLPTGVSHADGVRGVAFSPDGQLLATASTDGTAQLWNVADPNHPLWLATIHAHTGSVRDVAFSPTAPILATTSQDTTAMLWDIRDPARPVRLSTIREHTDTVRIAQFSPDGRMLATASNDHTAKLFDVSQPDTPKLLRTLTGHTGTVFGVAFSPNGLMLATCGADNAVRLWNLADPNAQPTAFTGHTSTVTGVAFGPGGTLATSSADHTAKLWDISDPLHPATLYPALSGHTGSVRAVAISTDGGVAATGSEDGTARLWDVHDPRHPEQKYVLPLGDKVLGVALDLDPKNGKHLLAAAGGRAVSLWEFSDPENPTLKSTFKASDNIVNALAFSKDGTILGIAAGDNTASLWDISDPAQPRALTPDRLGGQSSYLFALAFSPDGHTLATGSNDHTVQLWDISGPRPKNPVRFDAAGEAIQGVAFAPDSRTLATTSSDGTTKLWDIHDLRNPLATLKGNSAEVWGVAFSPDGRMLATTSKDRTIRLWSVADRGRPEPLATLEGHADVVNAVAFGPDGRRILTGSADRTAQLWEVIPTTVRDLVCATVKPRITQEQWASALPGIPLRTGC